MKSSNLKEGTIVHIKYEAWIRFLKANIEKLVACSRYLRVEKNQGPPYADLVNLYWDVLKYKFRDEDLEIVDIKLCDQCRDSFVKE